VEITDWGGLLTSGDVHWAEDLVQVALTKLYVHWAKTWHAGKNEAAVFLIPDSEGKTLNPQKEVYARQGQSTHMIVATNYAWSLSWQMFTLLKFAGSCHYK
jgi:hypothetical protein